MGRNCLVAILLFAPAIAGATSMHGLDANALANGAERVIVGRVEARQGIWAGTRIFTRNTIAVEETWLGPDAEHIDVLTIGGRVGEIGQSIAGAGRLLVGQRVVLFLVRGTGGAFHPVAMAQGIFYVERDSVFESLRRSLEGVRFITEPPHMPETPSELRRVVGEARNAR